jgi:hypothetical protein
MPDLANSQRRIHKATYVNIRAADTEVELARRAMIGRPLEKVNFARSLNVSSAELERMNTELGKMGTEQSTDAMTALLDVLSGLAEEGSHSSNLRFAPAMARIAPEMLAHVGRLVARNRRGMGKEAQLALDEIRGAYRNRLGLRVRSAASELAPAAPPHKQRQVHLTARPQETERRNAGFATPTRIPSGAALLVDRPRESRESDTANPKVGTVPIDEALRWGLEQSVPAAVRLRGLAHPLHRNASTLSPSVLVDLPARLLRSGEQADDVVNAFEELVKIEPIGRLHLERLEMTPVGVERGELVYSIPLAPTETVNVSNKEWSIRSEEFEQIVQDVFEEFSEEGVAEKNDLAQSTESQHRHATAFTLSGSYSYYGASVSIGYNSSSEDQQAQRDSRQQSISITRKASSRAKQEHKQSFKVDSVVGREEQSVRVITNPSETDPMRIDYYQLMRKWRTDLYRYGLRMTYDIVIPSPGSDLLRKLDELRVLEALIDRPFTIPLQPTAITREHWEDIAAQWNAKVDPPPRETVELYRHAEIEGRSEEDAEQVMVEAVEFVVDADYTITEASLEAVFSRYDDSMFDVLGDPEQPVFDSNWYNSTLSHLEGRSGDLAVVYTHQGLVAGSVQFTVTLGLSDEAYRRWQYESWSAIREAAEQAYYASRQLLSEQRDRLIEEMKQWDALTLRRMEREEIMKGILRWLFGPDFELVPSELQKFFEPMTSTAARGGAAREGQYRLLHDWLVADEGPLVVDNGSFVEDGPAGSEPEDEEPPESEAEPPPLDVILPTEENWQRVIQFGEMIKFLHHAIEWENVLYFTYPYFWDSPANWDFKRFLRHPDALHREFLRAGSARVVLTVRGGYEVDFARFVESGAMGDDHPYLTIAQEIQAYAQTNYPGIPPANPEDPSNEDDVAKGEQGKLIGRWYEYTPTSALDLSIDTPLGDMA